MVRGGDTAASWIAATIKGARASIKNRATTVIIASWIAVFMMPLFFSLHFDLTVEANCYSGGRRLQGA
jgi:hypothetical protein